MVACSKAFFSMARNVYMVISVFSLAMTTISSASAQAMTRSESGAWPFPWWGVTSTTSVASTQTATTSIASTSVKPSLPSHIPRLPWRGENRVVIDTMSPSCKHCLRFCGGLLANFSMPLIANTNFTLWKPSLFGCSPYQSASDVLLSQDVVALVREGNCTLAEKTYWAEQARVSGLIIVQDHDELIPLLAPVVHTGSGVFVLSVTRSLGDRLTTLLWEANKGVTLSFRIYKKGNRWWSAVFMGSLVVVLLVLGANIATTEDFPMVKGIEPYTRLSNAWKILLACIVCCIPVLALFLGMRYVVYWPMDWMAILFCICGVLSVGPLISICLRQCLYWCGCERIRNIESANLANSVVMVGANVVSIILATVLVALWVDFRSTPFCWIFQDLIGGAMLCISQRIFRLPNMYQATLLLAGMLTVYVVSSFISPLIFKGHIPMEISTGGGAKMMVPSNLRIPYLNDPMGVEMSLGFCDVALSSFLTSHLRKFDARIDQMHGFEMRGCRIKKFIRFLCLPEAWCRHTYFIHSLCAYVSAATIGLFWYRLHFGPVPLLFIVPIQLAAIFALGLLRGEFNILWNEDVWEDKPWNDARTLAPVNMIAEFAESTS